jgi:hypothetical protein
VERKLDGGGMEDSKRIRVEKILYQGGEDRGGGGVGGGAVHWVGNAVEISNQEGGDGTGGGDGAERSEEGLPLSPEGAARRSVEVHKPQSSTGDEL